MEGIVRLSSGVLRTLVGLLALMTLNFGGRPNCARTTCRMAPRTGRLDSSAACD